MQLCFETTAAGALRENVIAHVVLTIRLAFFRRPKLKMVVPLADPITIFMGGMLGVYFVRDLWFTIYVFLVQHYLILWAALEFYLKSNGMQYRFIFNMAIFFISGMITGMFLTWMLGNRVAVPMHIFVRRQLKLGHLLLAIALPWAPRALLIAIGAYDPNDNLPDDEGPQYYAVFAVWVIVALLVLIVTAIQSHRFPWFVNAFALLRYDDDKAITKAVKDKDAATATELRRLNRLNAGNVVWLILLLSPQAIWDFLFPAGTGPANDKARFALWGAVTLIVETIIWWGMWAIYRYGVKERAAIFFTLDKWPATRRTGHDYDGLLYFTLTGFLAQILAGIGYLIYGLVHDEMDVVESTWPLFGIALTFSIVCAILVVVHWDNYERKAEQKYAVLDTEMRTNPSSKKSFHVV